MWRRHSPETLAQLLGFSLPCCTNCAACSCGKREREPEKPQVAGIERHTLRTAPCQQSLILLVRMIGLEPTLPCGNWNLNPARLPISPHPHVYDTFEFTTFSGNATVVVSVVVLDYLVGMRSGAAGNADW